MLRTFLCLLAVACPLAAKPSAQVFSEGFERPIWVGAPPEDNDHVWVMEQEGKIWKVDAKTGKRDSKPFLDISKRVSRKGNEEGLLGLAFPKDFSKTGRFYLYYTATESEPYEDMTTYVERFFAVGPDFDVADDSKTEKLFEFKQPFRNHNGGWIDFGPDGYLYVGTGDGGSANDPHRNGQKLETMLGKILRVDVSSDRSFKSPADNPFVGKDGMDEIWAYGLRNPWRCSFDRETGDLWIGDVGQNKWEEINYLPAGSKGGANFGWYLREGYHKTPKKDVGGDKPDDNVDPVYEYDHGTGADEGLSVTGGYVYRGPIKSLVGRYIFADYQNRRIWSFVLKDGKASDVKDHTDELTPEGGKLGLISSFGEDTKGNLYIACFDGKVLKVVE